jgi:hypothetical protein
MGLIDCNPSQPNMSGHDTQGSSTAVQRGSLRFDAHYIVDCLVAQLLCRRFLPLAEVRGVQ